MARKKLIKTEKGLYHLTSRSNNKDWFYIPMEDVWNVFSDAFIQCSDYCVEIHCFVLMSNHFHMIVSTPQKNLDTWMRHLMTYACKKIQKAAKRINHIFGTRYKWSVLWGPYEVSYVYKYVLRNPVRAGMVNQVEQYPFSSLYDSLKDKYSIPLTEGIGRQWSFVPKNLTQRLQWLNSQTPKECETLIQKALKRFEFKFSTNSNIQNKLRMLKQCYGTGDMMPTF